MRLADTPSGASILVVEDEPVIRNMTAMFLIEQGFRVLEAANARDALGWLQSDSVSVDLVFSDIQMPGDLDGCDLARWICAHRPDVAVILTSGQLRNDVLGNDLLQFAPIETKPYRGDELVQRMRTALAIRKSRAGHQGVTEKAAAIWRLLWRKVARDNAVFRSRPPEPSHVR